VRLVRETARPVAQVARDLGIPENLLYRWRSQHQQAEAQGTTRVAQRTEAEERCSIIGSAATPRSAITPRPSMKRGRQLRNQVSTKLGEGQGTTGLVVKRFQLNGK